MQASPPAPHNQPQLHPQNVIPPGLNREKLHEYIQQWHQLKNSGATEENNVEYAKISRILQAVQRQQAIMQARVAASTVGVNQGANGVHGQQRRPQSPQLTQANGLSRSPQPDLSHESSTQVSSISTALPSHPSRPLQAVGPRPPSSFSQEQLTQLKAQITAFKKIAKNLPVPAELMSLLDPRNGAQHNLNHQSGQAGSQQDQIAAAGKAIEEAHKAQQSHSPIMNGVQSAATPSQLQVMARSDTIQQPITNAKSPTPAASISGPITPSSTETPLMSPFTFFMRPVDLKSHGERKNRPLIPAIFPVGVDLTAWRELKGKVRDMRIAQRIKDLESLPSNMLDLPSEIDDIRNIGSYGRAGMNEKGKMRAIIELKSLRMVEKQRMLRQKVLKAMGRMSTLGTSADRLMWRRVKKQSLREARLTESLERQQRVDRERREKQKHDDYLQGIIQHGRDLLNAGRIKNQRMIQLVKQVKSYHTHVEKEEQKRIERTAKQRLNALKANDEEAYLKLIDQAKDTRITHLLRQTNSYLDSLASAVAAQQQDVISRGLGYKAPVPSEVDEEDEEGQGPAKVDYYSVAHKIQEEVTQQPTILVHGQLKDYQIKGLQWMVSLYNNHLNGILADEMGLGKTIQTISLITFLIEKKHMPGPFLIIMPLSTMTNWALEFDKWAPSVKVIQYKGPPQARKSLAQQVKMGGWQVLMTTYEYIIKDKAVLSKVKWIHTIIDEGHRMKNAESKLSGTLRDFYHSRYRLILTGTPLQNNLPELWALLNFVLPKIFNSVKNFHEWFNAPFANTGTEGGMTLTEEETILIVRRLHKVLRPFLLRRLKKDVESELPDKVERVVKIKMSPLQQKLYQQLRNEGSLWVENEGGKVSKAGLQNRLMQFRKVCNHPYVFEHVELALNPTGLNNDMLWRVAGKFELLDRVLPKFKRSGHRVLIFFQMTQIMNIMEDFLLYRGYKFLRLDGTTKADERTEMLTSFNRDPEIFIFILSTRAGGLGLNLQVADTVIIYDSDWNPHQDLQAQDRAHRIGQTREVRILRFITEKSIEEHIHARALQKLDLDGKVIQAGKFDNKTSESDRELLLRELFATAQETGNESEEEEMDDDELNVILARSEDEKVLFAKIDREREKTSPYGKGKKFGRLIGEDELPAMYHEDAVIKRKEKEAQEEVYYGRGGRDRGNVRYNDGLTDEQWTMAVDNNEDLEELIEKREARKKKRLENKLKRQTGDVDGPESPAASDISYPRKRGRPAKSESVEPSAGKNKKRKSIPNDDSDAPTPIKKARRGRPPATAINDPLPPKQRRALKKIMDAVYDAVVSLNDEDDRDRSMIFMELPEKKLYPDYYKIIIRPMSFNMIQKRIEGSYYTSLQAFATDMKAVFSNARIYNEDGSLVYEDADALEEEYNRKMQEITGGDPSGGIVFDSQSVSGNVTNSPNSPEPTFKTGLKFKVKSRAIASDSGSEEEE